MIPIWLFLGNVVFSGPMPEDAAPESAPAEASSPDSDVPPPTAAPSDAAPEAQPDAVESLPDAIEPLPAAIEPSPAPAPPSGAPPVESGPQPSGQTPATTPDSVATPVAAPTPPIAVDAPTPLHDPSPAPTTAWEPPGSPPDAIAAEAPSELPPAVPSTPSDAPRPPVSATPEASVETATTDQRPAPPSGASPRAPSTGWQRLPTAATSFVDRFLPSAPPPTAPASSAEPSLVPMIPAPEDLMARGPDVASTRLLWFLLCALVATLSRRAAERTPPGAARRLIDRVRAAARAGTFLAGAGVILALVPLGWLPWLAIVAVSAAIAAGWSLRPYASDAVAGLYLGFTGRLSPGVRAHGPEGEGSIHEPGLFTSVIKTDDGHFLEVANRHIVARAGVAASPKCTSVEVSVDLPPEVTAVEGLSAIRSAIDMLPWSAVDPPPALTPDSQLPNRWQVKLFLLGRAPPTAKVQALLPQLVRATLLHRTSS